MRSRIGRLFLGTAFAVTLAGVAALAQTTPSVAYPDYPRNGPPLLSCDPGAVASANTIQISGIPEGADVTVIFTWSSPYGGGVQFAPQLNYDDVTGGSLTVPVSYPAETSLWPYVNATTNVREIQVNAMIMITGTTTSKLTTKGWWIRCTPPPAPKEGCTPGYWRQVGEPYAMSDAHLHSWLDTPYLPTDDFETVFGVDASFNPHTLGDAVWLGGGGENALARHAVAALLNAASPNVNYFYSVADVIGMVQAAYASGDFEATKDLLDFANNAGCPLN